MSFEQKLVTAEERWEISDVPGKRFELVDGEVNELSPAGDLHMAIVEIVYDVLRDHVRQHNVGPTTWPMSCAAIRTSCAFPMSHS